jgi:hypothetical protein
LRGLYFVIGNWCKTNRNSGKSPITVFSFLCSQYHKNEKISNIAAAMLILAACGTQSTNENAKEMNTLTPPKI